MEELEITICTVKVSPQSQSYVSPPINCPWLLAVVQLSFQEPLPQLLIIQDSFEYLFVVYRQVISSRESRNGAWVALVSLSVLVLVTADVGGGVLHDFGLFIWKLIVTLVSA